MTATSITLTDSAGTTTNVLERTVQDALDLARSADSPFRRHDDVAVAMPGGMFGHVHKGKLVSFGLEPVGDVLVDSQRKVSDLLDGDKGKVLWGRGRGGGRWRGRGSVLDRRCRHRCGVGAAPPRRLTRPSPASTTIEGVEAVPARGFRGAVVEVPSLRP